jgi:hypothetical protein
MPLKMMIAQAHADVKCGWASSHRTEATGNGVDSIDHQPLSYRMNSFLARLCFRGIYFSQRGLFAWLKLFLGN